LLPKKLTLKPPPLENSTTAKPRLLIAGLLASLSLLVCYSLYLALTRIYQVDECQNIYMARVLATGQEADFFTTASLFLVGPLSWITGNATHSVEVFTAARLVFLSFFWLNLWLIASIAGGRAVSVRGLIALVGAATLAPLWDYGFEIRHDVVILTGVLLIWWAVRVKPLGIPSYAIAGAVAVVLLLIGVKSVVYVVPLSCGILLIPPPGHRASRFRLVLAWTVGALLAAGLLRLFYGSGAWETYTAMFRTTSQVTAGDQGSFRFWPWATLGRLLGQTPLLLALTIAGCYAIAADLVQRRRAALTWEGNLPEALLLAGALAALLINPTPFPYNLLHLVPYAFVLAFKYGEGLWNEFRNHAPMLPLLAAILAFMHLAPFALASRRHLDEPNSRQESLMCFAEDLTDPTDDLVYDGIGMVPTRRSINFGWYLHSLNLRGMINVPGSRVRDMLAARPAAVLIPSYRTDWLPEEDHEFIRERYVPLADDFWVLGEVLPAGGGKFEIFHPGRYRIARRYPSKATTTYQRESEAVVQEIGDLASANLDGATIPNQPVELSVGTHIIETANKHQPVVIWVGPHLNDVPRVGPGSHRTLFRNWY